KGSKLNDPQWYWKRFIPKMKEYYKGDLVFSEGMVQSAGSDEQRKWAMYGDKIYDLTDYFHTQSLNPRVSIYEFLDSSVSDLFKNKPGQNIKSDLDEAIQNSMGNQTQHAKIMNSWNCVQTVFYKGKTDFRETPRCTVNNWILLAFSMVLCAVILIKFIAALRFSSK